MLPAEIGGKIALVVGGALIGASSTYLLTKRHLENKYEAIISEYEKIEETDKAELQSDNSAREIKSYHERMEDLGYIQVDEVPAEAYNGLVEDVKTLQEKFESGEAVVTVNGEQWVAEDPEEESDEPETPAEPEESPVRDTSKPYIISFDEWFETANIPTVKFTYFEEDGIMIDDREQIVFNEEDLVGTDFVNWFGWKTDGDNDLVYIRNPKLDTDYEITREESSYRDFVLQDVEEQMTEAPTRNGVRKMRED